VWLQVEERVSSWYTGVSPKSRRLRVRRRNTSFPDDAVQRRVVSRQLAQTRRRRDRTKANLVSRLRYVAGAYHRRVADVDDARRRQATVDRISSGTCCHAHSDARQPQGQLLLLDDLGLSSRQRLRDLRLSGQQVGAAGLHIDDCVDGLTADQVPGEVRRGRSSHAGRDLDVPSVVRTGRVQVDAGRVDRDGGWVAGVCDGDLLVLG